MLARWLVIFSLTWQPEARADVPAGDASEDTTVLDPAAERVATLLAKASDGTLDLAWFLAHADPGPAGWTQAARLRWAEALRPGGPLLRALATSPGIVHVDHHRAGQTVVLEGPPALAVHLDASGTITAIEPTTCERCDARWRFAQDAIARVRRTGRLVGVFQPGFGLDVTRHLEENRSLKAQHWTANLDTYLAVDPDVVAAIGSAVIVGQAGPEHAVRYADGRRDTWVITWRDDRGWAIDYAALGATSPFRLDARAAKRWRKSSTLREARPAAYAPTRRRAPDGLGAHLGDHAVGAGWDHRDDTVVIGALDVDASLAAFVRIHPDTGVVRDRLSLPRFTSRPSLDRSAWAAMWPFLLAPSGDRAAMATPIGVYEADLDAGSVSKAFRAPGHVQALAYDDGLLYAALDDGRVWRGGDIARLPDGAVPIALDMHDGRWSVVTDAGEVWGGTVGGDAPPERYQTVCAGRARAADMRRRDGAWLVLCDGRRGPAHAWAPALGGTVVAVAQAFPSDGRAAAITADGTRYATPGPEGLGMVIWRDGDLVPETTLAVHPMQQIAWSSDADRILGVTLTGEVWWWHLPDARPARAVVQEVDP